MNDGLKLQRDCRFPPKSCLFRLGSDGAVLTCGAAVEAAADSFFEGAWAGSFPGRDFHRVSDVFGSGAYLSDEGWMLVPPSHTLEAIYVLQDPKFGWLCSNSLAFLLTATRASLHFRWPKTLVDFIGIVDGITSSPRRTLTSHGNLHLLHQHNALLGAQLQIRPKPSAPSFANFENYRDYLVGVMVATAENAAHPARRNRYRLLATLSSGYDSPACAAIARAAGCSEGLTFTQSRGGKSDDGSQIGAHIGLQMSSVSHPLFSDTDDQDASGLSDFFATGMQGEDVTYAPLRGLLRERLLVTGFHGDGIWDLSAKPNTILQRKDVSGSSLGEFRLCENFVHLPLPFVGALQHPAVHAISTSSEMQPYVLGRYYDRPIPRRIAEEAGVPRHLFGQSKKAISTLVFKDRKVRPPCLLEVEARIRAQPLLARLRYELSLVWYTLGMSPYRQGTTPGARYLPAALARIYRRVWSKLARMVWPHSYQILEHLDPISIYTQAWALSLVADRYRLVLQKQPGQAEVVWLEPADSRTDPGAARRECA